MVVVVAGSKGRGINSVMGLRFPEDVLLVSYGQNNDM